MTDGSAGAFRSHFWRIGWLVCGIAAILGVMGAIAIVASAQPAVTPNPELKPACGLRVMLVLDESASIVSPGSGLGNQVPVVRNASTGFVTALEDTGSPLALTAFHSFARQGVPQPPGYSTVTPGNISTFTNWINNVGGGGYNPPSSASTSNTPPNPTGTTNWQDAFDQVGRTPGGPPDLVVFVTDGDPNTVGIAGSPTAGNSAGTGRPFFISNNTAGFNQAVIPAVAAANAIKARSRVFAIGVGPATNNAASADRLKLISGDRAGTNPFADDFTLVANFADLRAELIRIVSAMCGSHLIINKSVLNHVGEPVSASGWRFTATLESPAHTWLDPEHGTQGTATDPSASLTTNNTGRVEFHWRLHNEQATARLGIIHEQERAGFHFVSAQCFVHRLGGVEALPINTTVIPGADLKPQEFQTCDVLNRQSTARLTVVKHLDPTNDPGTFNLEINHTVIREGVGHGGSTGPRSLPLGMQTVSETAAPGTDLADYDTSIRCVDVANGDHLVAHGPGTSLPVHLTSQAEDIVCTITNVSTKSGQLTVIKHLIPADDHGTFNLLVNGAIRATAVGDAGHTPPIVLPFGTHTVTETGANGTDLSHYNISTTCIDEHTGDTVTHNAHGPDVSVVLSRTHDSIECTIQNERPAVKVARLEVVKHLVPHVDAGIFDLVIGGKAFALGVGHNGSTGPLDFELGPHAVTEHAAGLTRLADFAISTTCVDKAHGGHTVAHNAHGPSVTVHLNSEADNVVCTITNKRTEAPGEGGGEPPPTTVPKLGVDKRKPRTARVGELVPITVTVHNLGGATAHGVQLHETPPPGMRIVAVANGGTIHHGVAVWHLGSLAPGQSRTVHATARVVHTGLHVDTAVATALNADPALSNAALRARAAARPPRPPTPPPPVVTG